MDPTKALADLRDLIERLDGGEINPRAIVDTFTGLDEWLTEGGFLPEQWKWARHARPG